jgi:hypothetical protein
MFGAVIQTEAGGFSAAVDTTLTGKLTGTAALGVDISLTVHVDVGILDPGHNLFVGAHVGTEAIDLGSNETFLCEFHSVATGDYLNFADRVLGGVERHATLSTTEWNISNA